MLSGHKATLRAEPLIIDGTKHTHDWEVWVKGIDGNRIDNYVDKVENFTLSVHCSMGFCFLGHFFLSTPPALFENNFMYVCAECHEIFLAELNNFMRKLIN